MTTEKTLYRPAKGDDGQPLKVRKPDGGYLSDDGEALVLDTYWLRRLQDNDIESTAPIAGVDPTDPPSTVKTGKAIKAVKA